MRFFKNFFIVKWDFYFLIIKLLFFNFYIDNSFWCLIIIYNTKIFINFNYNKYSLSDLKL